MQVMKNNYLTKPQKEWIREIKKSIRQNNQSFLYVPKYVCDTESGKVYSSCEGLYGGIEIIDKIGEIPIDFIPNRYLDSKEERIFRVSKKKPYYILESKF